MSVFRKSTAWLKFIWWGFLSKKAQDLQHSLSVVASWAFYYWTEQAPFAGTRLPSISSTTGRFALAPSSRHNWIINDFTQRSSYHSSLNILYVLHYQRTCRKFIIHQRPLLFVHSVKRWWEYCVISDGFFSLLPPTTMDLVIYKVRQCDSEPGCTITGDVELKPSLTLEFPFYISTIKYLTQGHTKPFKE